MKTNRSIVPHALLSTGLFLLCFTLLGCQCNRVAYSVAEDGTAAGADGATPGKLVSSPGVTSSDAVFDPPGFFINEAALPEGFPGPGPVDRVILKRYPAYRAAFVSSEIGGPNRMFSPLFDHIKRNNIAMTAPVEMGFAPESKPGPTRYRLDSMGFLYGAPGMGSTGQEGRVLIRDMPPLTVLSVGVRGNYGASTFRKGLDQILAHIEANPGRYRQTAEPRYMAYNSPLVPFFMKYGEVQLPVEVLADAP